MTNLTLLINEKKNCNSSYVCEPYIGLFYPLTTNAPHHIETSQWFARLGAIWPGTLVAIGCYNEPVFPCKYIFTD